MTFWQNASHMGEKKYHPLKQYQRLSVKIPPPSAKFWEKEGGVSVKNFFVKDFLRKNFPALRAGGKQGGVSVVLYPDIFDDTDQLRGRR